MKQSGIEKAGGVDKTKIFDGVHLHHDFIKNMAINPESIDAELKETGDTHCKICEKCNKERESFLPFSEKGE